MSSEASAPKIRVRKPRKAKKAVPNEDRVAHTLQKEMEGLLILAEPQLLDAANRVKQDAEPSLQDGRGADTQAGGPQYVITNGPNDPIPPGPGIFAIPGNTHLGAQHQLSVPTIPTYPAGIPAHFTGVIDPALIGLRAEPPPQLHTPRPSVTPNLSPEKQATSSATSPLTPGTVTPVKRKPKAISQKPTLSSIAEGSLASHPAKPMPRQPIKPRPRGTAKEMLGRPPTGLATPTATSASTSRTNELPVTPSRPEGKRRSADILAAEEASRINTPAKRVRTPKIRTK